MTLRQKPKWRFERFVGSSAFRRALRDFVFRYRPWKDGYSMGREYWSWMGTIVMAWCLFLFFAAIAALIGIGVLVGWAVFA